MKEEMRMMCENKSAAYAVNGSIGGRVEQISKAVSTPSVPETGRLVKSVPGGLDCGLARRLVAMLTERQRRNIVRLALVIQEAGE